MITRCIFVLIAVVEFILQISLLLCVMKLLHGVIKESKFQKKCKHDI